LIRLALKKTRSIHTFGFCDCGYSFFFESEILNPFFLQNKEKTNNLHNYFFLSKQKKMSKERSKSKKNQKLNFILDNHNDNNINFNLQQYAAFNQALFNRNETPNQQQQDANQSFFQMLEMTPLPIQQSELPPSPSSTVNDSPIRVTRPPNAYLLFNKEQRKILKDQFPTMKVAAISKEIGQRWRNMPKVLYIYIHYIY
jgi:hypothetical protein